MSEAVWCCDVCKVGQDFGCPHAEGIHYDVWGEGIEPPEYCPQREDEDGDDLPF